VTQFSRLARTRTALSAVIVCTLALGIGAATALYSVIDAVLLRPFPFKDQNRLVMLWQADVVRHHPFVEVSYPDALDWAARTGTFESLAAMSSVNFGTTLTGIGDPRQLQIRVVADRFFDVLGTPALLGRTFTRDEHKPGSGHVTVIGYGLWQSLFGGDPNVIGRRIVLDSEPHTIVGVMPREFRFPEGAELWAPVEQAIPTIVTNRIVQWMVAVGRLRDGVSVEQGRAALDLTIASLIRDHQPPLPPDRPQSDSNAMRAVVRPLVGELLGTTRQALLLLLCAVGVVLVIACVNVSNLLLSRAVDRRREIATRIVLGASRAHIARQLIGEVLPLAIAGGVIGVGLAWLAVESLVRIAGAELPRAADIRIDPTAVAVAGGISIAAGLLCALAPLIQARDVTLGVALKDDTRSGTSRSQRRLRDVLVTAEIALALMLLVGAALLIGSFRALRSQDLGFRPTGVLSAEIAFSSPKYEKQEQALLAQRALVERFRAIPGVTSASAVALRPLWSQVGNDLSYVLEGQTNDQARLNPVANLESAMPQYFATMGIRLIAGRDFTERDDNHAPGVIIVSGSFARRSWPNQEPLGRRLRFKDAWLTVVGVVADVRYREIETARMDVYQPYAQFSGLVRHFVIKTMGDPLSIAGDVRRAVAEVDPSQPVDLLTMDDIVATAMGRWRLNARLFGGLAILALLLAAVGTYSVINYAVSRRTQEIGVRIALGAGQRQIARMVLKDGLRLAGLGVALGTIAAFATTGFLRHLLIGIGPHDPRAFAGAAALLCVVAVIACLVPARRAAGVDPMVAMRTE
jgi:predicted permease